MVDVQMKKVDRGAIGVDLGPLHVHLHVFEVLLEIDQQLETQPHLNANLGLLNDVVNHYIRESETEAHRRMHVTHVNEVGTDLQDLVTAMIRVGDDAETVQVRIHLIKDVRSHIVVYLT